MNQKYNSLLALFNTFFPYPPSPYPAPTNVMTLSTAQTATGLKTFSVLPESSVVPTTGDQLVNKTYADSLIPTPVNAVTIDGSQTLLTGVKTFTNLPECSAVPTTGVQLVNKTYVDGLVGATPNLSAVLAVGNSAGANSINMNTNAISAISTATAKTSLVVDNSVAGANATLTQSNLTINATGLSGLPSLTLNQSGVGSGLLTEEFYNQRTAQTGEFNRMSFYGKNSAGTKTEYARIHQNAPVITSGSQRGRIDLAVQTGSGLTDYLTLNGQTADVNIGATLDLNSNNIVSINNASTQFSSQLTPQQVFFLTADSATSLSAKDTTQRAVYINTGVPPSLQSVGVATLASWNYITASYSWNGYTWVATANGEIYYSNDPNGSWNSLGVLLNGVVNCFIEWNGTLVFGGNFTQDNSSATTLNRIGFITTTPALSVFTWSNTSGVGFNNEVLALEIYNNYLYIGGAFTADGAGSNLNYLAIVDTGYNIYNCNNNTADGFNAPVRAICNDTGSNRFIIGGDFTNFTTGGSGFFQQYYLQIDFDLTTSYNVFGFFTLSPSLNSPVYNIVKDTNTNALIIAGNFTSISPYTDYMFEMFWNGSSYQPQSFSYSAPSQQPSFLTRSSGTSYIYWGQNNVLYSSDGWSQTSPVGGQFTTAVYGAWGQDCFSTNSGSQNPVVLYFRNTSNSINIQLNNTLYGQGGGTYTNNINLASKGNSVELIWNAGENAWYVLSNEGATFS